MTNNSVAEVAPIAVFIPTYNRGSAVFSVLEKLQTCNPLPAEVWVHIDASDGILEAEIAQRFPSVEVLTSHRRLGPGGGRHRCLAACKTAYAVSFDDDFVPVDTDFLLGIEQLFLENPKAAIFGANIWHRHQNPKPRIKALVRVASYIGCGYAIRLNAYRQVRGHIPRPVPYGMEETDLSLQLFAAGWETYLTGDFRVYHDTEFKHHRSAEITAGVITNVGLFAFLHYPVVGWGWGLLQLANIIAFSIRAGRLRGIVTGIIGIPIACYRCRHYRRPIFWRTLISFLRFRRTHTVL